MPEWAIRVIFAVVAVGLGWVLLRLYVQRRFFYPSRTIEDLPEGPCEPVRFPSTDGTQLTGWFLPAAGEAKATVVHMHGNAGNIGHHYPMVEWLPAAGYNVLMFDYRGYGGSAGRPSIGGLIDDARAAIEYARGRDDVDGGRLLVFGQSIGASIAATVVGRHDPPGVRGVLLDSPFASYRRIVAEAMRQTIVLFPLSLLSPLLIGDAHSPARYIERIAPRPVMFLHGADDRIVPAAHSEALFRRAGEPKALQRVRAADHLWALREYPETYRPIVLEFFEGCLSPAPSHTS